MAPIDVGDGLDEAHIESEHMLAISIVTMICLNIVSLSIGQFLHSKHILWLPECGVTIIVGFAAGIAVGKILPPDVERTETGLYFDPIFFTLFLLPPIIFEAGYSIDMPLFAKNMGKILALAIAGTLISTAITWYALYTDRTDYLIDLSFSESGQFAALISAVDPVATLALFGTLQVDAELNNIVVGESVLNDAVALIAFRAVTHYGINMKDEYESIILSFIITGLGSAAMGVMVGAFAAFSLKIMGMGKPSRSDLLSVETVIFIAFAYVSFVGAELPENSGIVSALFAGFTMRAYARPNLSPAAAINVDAILKVMSTFADNTIYLLVGFALTIELEYVTNADKEGTTLDMMAAVHAFLYVIVLAVAVRALHLFPILGTFNLKARLSGKPDDLMPCSQQIICWFSGLRGAIAVALAYQVTGDNLGGTANNKHIIRAATMMVVVFTTFAFGGATPSLLACLKIPMGVTAVPVVNKAEGVFAIVENVLTDKEVAARQAQGYKELAA